MAVDLHSEAFTPVQLGPVRLKNRFIRAGANEMMTHGVTPSKSLLEFHTRLAAGGVGMTTLAYVAVSKDGRTFSNQGVINAETAPHYQAIAEAVHAEGAKISMQITHAGSFVQHDELTSAKAMSASGGLDQIGMLQGRFLQRAMTRYDMDQVREEFLDAAGWARAAGFDAVEIHMGHGYLLNQFISPLSNRRTDQYGGSAQARAKYPVEILTAIKRKFGHELAVLVKMNLTDGAPRGSSAEDAIATAAALEAAGADMLVLSGGRNIEAPWAIFHGPLPIDAMAKSATLMTKLQLMALKAMTPKSLFFEELYFLPLAKQVRAAVNCPLCYVGGVLSLDSANKVLGMGFDAVAMARALVHDPALINRFLADPEGRSGCTSCNECVATMYLPTGTYCTLTDNRIPAALNRMPAGARETHLASPLAP